MSTKRYENHINHENHEDHEDHEKVRKGRRKKKGEGEMFGYYSLTLASKVLMDYFDFCAMPKLLVKFSLFHKPNYYDLIFSHKKSSLTHDLQENMLKTTALLLKILCVTSIMVFASHWVWRHIRYDICRPMIDFASKHFRAPVTVAEIGVFYGTNTRRIFKKLSVKKMFLIDPFMKYENYSEKKILMFLLPSSFKPALTLLGKRSKKKVVPLKMTSRDAAGKISDELEMVYIDGNHDYEYVKSDIESYYPKVKPGGLIGGHDINGKTAGKGVKRAVFEFANKNNLFVHTKEPDWWIVKPERN